MEDFILYFKDLFDDESIILNPDTKFRDLNEWDSIKSLALVGMIDDEYGVTVNSMDMRKCETISDLYDIIKVKH